MATITPRLAALRDGCETLAQSEEELRVLTALIGCIMVADEADESQLDRTPVEHLSQPARCGDGKAV